MRVSPDAIIGAIPVLYAALGTAWFLLTGITRNAVETQQDVAFVLVSAIAIWLFQRWALRRLISSRLESVRSDRRSQQEKARLHDILMKLPVVLIATNNSGEYVFWNYEAERMLGYSDKEMLHRPGAAQLLRVDPEYDLRMRQAFQDHTGDARAWEWKLRAKDGSIRSMLFHNVSRSAPVPGWHSWAVGMDTGGHDTGESRLRGVLEHLPVAGFVTDALGNCCYVNPAMERLFGYSAAQMQGKHPGDLICKPPHALDFSQIAASSSPVVIPARTRAGDKLQCRWRSIPLEKAAIANGFLVTAEDLTDFAQANEAARSASANLEKRVLRVNKDLAALQEAVEAFSALLSRGQAEESVSNDFLKLLQISQKDPQVRSIDLTSMASEVGRVLLGQETGRSIEFNVEPNLRCQGDPAHIRVLLENLLSNALKFTRPRATALIELGQFEDGFFVRDNGVGFDIRLAHLLFRPFQKLHNDREFAGSGIGLAVVKRIVQKHDGKVQANGVPGGGATITFSIGTTPHLRALPKAPAAASG